MAATANCPAAHLKYLMREDTASNLMHDTTISPSSSSTHATDSPQEISVPNDFEDYSEPPVPRPMNSWCGPGSQAWAERQLAWNIKYASDPIKLAQWPAPLPEEEYWGPTSEQQPQHVENWGPAPKYKQSCHSLDWDGRAIFGPFKQPFHVHDWLSAEQERMLEELAFDGCSTVYSLEFFERIYGQRTRYEWAQAWCGWDSVLQRYYHVEDFLAEGGEGGWWPADEPGLSLNGGGEDQEAGDGDEGAWNGEADRTEEAELEDEAGPKGHADFDAQCAAMWQRTAHLSWGAEPSGAAEPEGDADAVWKRAADSTWGADPESEGNADTVTEAEPTTDVAGLSDDEASPSDAAKKDVQHDGYHMHEVEGGEVVEIVVDADALW